MRTFLIPIFLALFVGAGCAPSGNETAGPAAATALAGDIDAESGSRLPLLRREDLSDEESARVYDRVAGPEGRPPRGTLGVALYSPRVAEAIHEIRRYLETESPLGNRRVELLVLVTAREMNMAYEWSVHEEAALAAGLEPDLIDAIRYNRTVAGFAQTDALMITFGRQLFRQRHVDRDIFARTVERLGRQGTFDAIMVISHWAMAGVIGRAVDLQPAADWDPARFPPIGDVGTPIGTPGTFISLPDRPPLPPDIHADSYYRFPLLRRDDLDEAGRAVFDRMVGAEERTAPRGPVGMAFNSPRLVEPVRALNTALRRTGVLDTRLAEIVIAATGREMNSQYQWAVHGAQAARAGAEAHVLDAIRYDRDLAGLEEPDALAIGFTRELFRNETVTPETYRRAVELFGLRGMVEIAALAGDYLMVTTMYNALGMRLGENQDAALPHRAGAPVGAEWR